MLPAVINLTIKVLFLLSIGIHVLLWPSYAHIVFACALALEGVVTYFLTPKEDIEGKIYSPSLFFFHDEKSVRSYGSLVIILFYMLYTFLWFANDEIAIQPRMTTWIDNSLVNNYTFNDNRNSPFSGIDVTSTLAKKMRDNSFEWQRSFSADAIQLVGPIKEAYIDKGTVNCLSSSTTTTTTTTTTNNGTTTALNSTTTPPPPLFACFASNLYAATPPSDISSHPIIPIPSQFYTVDVKITPPAGFRCQNLEIYRIVMDAQGNVDNGLDYPASTVVKDSNTNLLNRVCGLFNISGWCLQFQHTFSAAEYASRVATKCAEGGGGTLSFRLPPRTIDIEPSTGRAVLDVLLVTPGAQVHLDFHWQDMAGLNEPTGSLISSFQKPWVNPDDDGIADWRNSSSKLAVFFKFFFLVIPFLFAWYYLAVHFLDVVVDSQILLLCIFVLLPSILLFLSMGAWLPMAGSIICVIAINHDTPATQTPPSSKQSWYRKMIRPVLFCLTAGCNSIQFSMLLSMVGQAGWAAFLYEDSIKQLGDFSSRYIISDTTSPTWVGLMLPSLLLVNLKFLLGSAICIVFETLPHFSLLNRFSTSPTSSSGGDFSSSSPL